MYKRGKSMFFANIIVRLCNIFLNYLSILAKMWYDNMCYAIKYSMQYMLFA